MHQLRRYRKMVGLCPLLYALLAYRAASAQEVITSEAVNSQAAVTTTSSNMGLSLPSGEPIYSSGLDGPILPLGAIDSIGLAMPFGRRLHLSLALGSGYDDNVNSSGIDQMGSAFVNGSLGLRYEFGSPRTQLVAQTGGSITDYVDTGTRDYSGYLGLQLTHRVSTRMTFSANAYATYTSEPNLNLNLGINRRVGSYFYSTDEVSLSYVWTPRFSTVSSYTFNTFLQIGQNNPPLIAGDLSNIGSSQDRIENTFSNQFRYLLLPTTTALIDYRLTFTTYQQNSAFDSVTNSLLAGFDHTFSPRLNVSLRGGIEYRSYQSSGDSFSPTFEGTVNYILGRRSSLSWFTNYSLQPADIPGSAERTVFRTGVNGR
ncbi:MAG: hypothetical protein QOH31_1464, partial [Verrucomicrobiota bacterium]